MSAKDVASGVLPSEIPSQTRSARLKELIKLFNDQEILEYAFPRVATNTAMTVDSIRITKG